MHTQEQATVCTRTLLTALRLYIMGFFFSSTFYFFLQDYLEFQSDKRYKNPVLKHSKHCLSLQQCCQNCIFLLLLHLKQFLHSGVDISH